MSFKANLKIESHGIDFKKKQVEAKVFSRGSSKEGAVLVNQKTGEKTLGEKKWKLTGLLLVFVNGAERPIHVQEITVENYDPNRGAEKQLYEVAKNLPIFSEVEDTI
ncbi:hypothetical protein LJC11_03055 [Bacteroidales bacterium OttesenSCG-928-I21]|nr:hypothetical protein [Bacteroidales bacterium OttesenSCG-928-I21]